MAEKYLRHFCAPKMDTIGSLNVDISLQDYKSFWFKKRESTAASPHGLHVGHYKVCAASKKLAPVQRMMMLAPFQVGFLPKRWRKTVQLMLEKDTGIPWLLRLRIIELFDGQLNVALQILVGRQMVHKALREGNINQAEFGSVSVRMAQGAILHKVLTLDYIRLYKHSGALFECDATGCYDRIIPALQAIYTQRLGVRKEVNDVIIGSLQNSGRHICTRHGILK